MVKKRIFSVILAVLLLVCCMTEAFFIKVLQSDNKKQKEEIAALQEQAQLQETQIQTLSDTVSAKADEPKLKFYLPENMYVCTSQGGDIYNDSVVYGINPDNYVFYWESAVGNSLQDRFEIPPMTEVGDYDVTLHIYDLSLNELVAKTTVIHVEPDEVYPVNDTTGFVEKPLLKPVVYSRNPSEIPELLTALTEEIEEDETPNAVIIFPSAYEVYGDLEGTMASVRDLVGKIKELYGPCPILIVEPSYPADSTEEIQTEEPDASMQKWAYAQKTMVFELLSALEENYIEDPDVYIVHSAFMTNSQDYKEKVGNSVYGVLCHLAQNITIE